MVIEISSLPELQKFAKKLASGLAGGETLALVGNLGAGKTTLTKILLKELGVRSKIASPTFVLMLPYKGRGCTIYHMDLYRIASYKEIAALGIEQLWNKNGNIFVIEWAEKIKKKLPKNTITIKITVASQGRKIQILNATKKLEKMLSA